MANGADIIIKGGSVQIEFNEETFPGQGGQYGNKGRKIVSVDVTDDDTAQKQTVTVPENGKCTIRVNTR